jgi:hypothetical protein
MIVIGTFPYALRDVATTWSLDQDRLKDIESVTPFRTSKEK